MKNQRGFSFAEFLVSVVTIVVVGAGVWYYLNSHTPPSGTDFLPQGGGNTHASQTAPAQSNSTQPSCAITSSLKTVTSADEQVPFSWTSKNADHVNTKILINEYDSFSLPTSGSATVQARNTLEIKKIGSTIPDVFRLHLAAIGGGNEGDCTLEIPYQPATTP